MTGGRRVAAACALAGGLVVAALTAGNGLFLVADQSRREPFFRPEVVESFAPSEGEPGPAPDVPLGFLLDYVEVSLQLIFGGLLLALLVVSVWGFLRGLAMVRAARFARGAGGVVPPAYTDEDSSSDDADETLRRRVRRELDALQGALDEGDSDDARDAVIACYARMEAAAAAAGTPRARHETPAELVARLLASHPAPAADVRRLTALFEYARFSQHPVDAAMTAAARESLAAIRDSLGANA